MLKNTMTLFRSLKINIPTPNENVRTPIRTNDASCVLVDVDDTGYRTGAVVI